MCPPDFLFNVTIDANNKIIGIYAGNWQTAHLEGTKAVRKHMTVAVDELFDVVITTGGGYPLDTTFYQTTKGMEVASYYVKPGGKLIVLSGCADGIGSQQYRTIMLQYDNYQQFLADIANTGKVRKDQWAFQMHARVLDKVGPEGLIMAAQGISDDELARCHVTPICQSMGSGSTAEQMQKLVDILADGSSTVALLPRGPYILPKVPAQ